MTSGAATIAIADVDAATPFTVAGIDEFRTAIELDAALARAEVYAPKDIEEMAQKRGLSYGQALHAMRLESATVGLEAYIEAISVDEYAGMWLATGDRPGLTVAFTDDDNAREALIAERFGYPTDISFVTVERPLLDLVALQREMREARSRLQAGLSIDDSILDETDGWFDLGIDVRSNQVTVGLEAPTDALRQAFQTRWGRDVVSVRRGVQRPECAQANCYDNMMGGLKLQRYDTINDVLVNGCTSGFSALNGSTRYVLSAAHCKYSSRYHAGQYYGYMHHEQFYGRVDAEAIIRDAAWDMKGKVWLAADDRRSIYYYITWGNITLGTEVTKSGWKGGTQKGDVTEKYHMPLNMEDAERFVLADYCGSDGDSGGSVIRNNTAYGIHHGGDDVGPGTDCPTPEVSSFGAINYAMNALDVALQAGP